MKCPKCKDKMICVDSRWDNDRLLTTRKWRCVCGMWGKTTERWESAPVHKVKSPKDKPKVSDINILTAKLAKKLLGTKPKVEKVKHTPIKSLFDDVDEDSYSDDIGDLGLNIPNNDW